MIDCIHRPAIFIGSSTQSLKIAETLQKQLNINCDAKVWDQSFPLSETTLESIVNNLNKADFGIFILSDDDVATIKNHQLKITRDNVIFESGMSIGTLGRQRTFLVAPLSEPDLHLPTDLLGFTIATYKKELFAADPDNAMKHAADQIQEVIKQSLWAKLNLKMYPYFKFDDKDITTFKLKIWLEFENCENFPITCQSYDFKLKDFFVQNSFRTQTYTPLFFHHNDTNTKKDIRKSIVLLQPEEKTNCYIPIERESSLKIIKNSPLTIECGEFHLTCIAHKERIEVFHYELKISTNNFQSNQIVDFDKNKLRGSWVNQWPRGKETLLIDGNFNYFINEEDDPAFNIRKIKIDNNKITFTKKSLNSIRPDFENELTLIDKDILVGQEWTSGKNIPHSIRYTRIK